MILAIKLFCFFAVICFSAGSAGYLALRPVLPEGWVFGALYSMYLYHWEYPFQYILLIAVIYGMVATIFAIALRKRAKTSRLAVFSIMVLTILAASPLGGILWVIHDMQAGYFTEGARFRNDLAWGALEGVRSGWLVILLSVPYNMLGLVAGYFVTAYGFGLARSNPPPKSSLPRRRKIMRAEEA